MAALLVPLAIAAVAGAVVWVGATLLERGSLQLAHRYGMPPAVEGAVVLAVGSSFPELASAVLATILHGAFDLGIGVIVGSALFNLLVIPAVSVLASGTMVADRDLVVKEGLFYMLAIATLGLVLTLAWVLNPTGIGLEASMTRPLGLSLAALYGVYLLFQWLESREQPARPLADGATEKAWASVLAGLVLILLASEGLVRAALMLGDTLGTSSFVWGVTVIAVATSLPDLFASLRASQAGRDDASLANAIGSNTFDVLVALPAGVILAGAATVNLATAGPMLIVLGGSTLVMVLFLWTGMRLTRGEAHTALGVYGLAVVALLDVGGVVEWLPWL